MYTNTLLTALNLIQVEVVFNQEVEADSAEDAGNYDVEDMTIADAALKADMKTVVLTLTEATAQQDALDVTVDAVETAEELALEEVVFEEVAFLDTTIPTIVSAEVVGIDTIKVTFSEPMTKASLQTKANYSVDGGDLYINTVVAMTNNTEANITLYSDLEEGDVTVKVKASVEDEAGFGVIQNTLTATVTEDEDAPIVVAFKDATTSGVTLVFNEEIEIVEADKGNYYHTNSNNEIKQDIDTEIIVTTAMDLSSDGKELTLDFSTNKLPEGTAYVYILKESVRDLWDNENAQIMFKIEVTLDVTAPEVDSVKVRTEEKIEVKFTEEVVKADAEDEDNYTILDKDGDEVKDVIDDINYTSKVATIEFNDTLSGKYSIVVKNIEDPAENEMATATVEFEVDDLTAPDFADFTAKIYNEGKAGQMIRISFGEEMNADGNYSVVDFANYKIGTKQLVDLVDDYDAEIALTDNGEAVEITIPYDKDNDEKLGYDFDDTDSVELARVADAAGNYTVSHSAVIDIVEAGNVKIDDVEITAVDTVVVTFDDLLDEFDADDLEIQNEAGAKLALAKKSISMDSDGNTVITLTLKVDLDYTGKSTTDTVRVSATIVDADAKPATAPDSENKFGETLLVGDTKVGTDDIAAELFTDNDADTDLDYLKVTGNNEFTLQFTEDIKGTPVSLIGSDLIVKADNDVLVLNTDYTVVVDGDATKLVFTLVDDFAGFDGDITVERASSTNYLTDLAGNDVDAFETDELAVSNDPEVTAFTIVSDNDTTTLAKEGDKVTVKLSFSEKVTVSAVTTTTANNVGAVTTDLDASAATSDTIVFTVVAGQNGVITIADIAFTITDAEDNAVVYANLAAVTAEAAMTGTVTADTTVPAVVSANLTSATTLVIVYDAAVESVLADYTPVSVDSSGGAGTAVSFTASAIAGSGTTTITLTVAGNTPLTADCIAVIAIGNTVIDLAGNAIIAVPNQAVASGF